MYYLFFSISARLDGQLDRLADVLPIAQLVAKAIRAQKHHLVSLVDARTKYTDTKQAGICSLGDHRAEKGHTIVGQVRCQFEVLVFSGFGSSLMQVFISLGNLLCPSRNRVEGQKAIGYQLFDVT